MTCNLYIYVVLFGRVPATMSQFSIKWRDIFLTHESPELFYGPQCRIPLFLFVAWRLVISAYMLSIITFNQSYKFDRDPNPFVFLTNWDMMFQALALCIKAIVTVYVGTRENCKRADQLQEKETYWKMAWYMKIEWVFHNISSVIPITVLNYWTGYKYQKAIKWNQPFFFFFTVQTHGLVAIVAVVDIILGAIPTRLLHVYQPMLFYVVYYIFSAIYQSVNGKFIYSNMDWDFPGLAITDLIGRLTLVVVIHIGIWFFKNMQTKWCCNPTPRRQKAYFDEETPLMRHDLLKNDNDYL